MLKLFKLITIIVFSPIFYINSFTIATHYTSSINKLSDKKTLTNKYSSIKGQCIIDKKLDYEICDISTDFFMDNNTYIRGKKLIVISPAGLKGFYLLGIMSYIKENYDTSDYIFTGASAGAFNALFATYKHDPIDIVNILDMKNILSSRSSMSDLQKKIKRLLLKNFATSDFDLDKLFIGITGIKNFKIKTNIYHHFIDLEDAINACIASSNIPFITGNLFHKYNNIYSFDGGFSKYPFLHLIEPTLHITSDIWKRNLSDKRPMLDIINDFTTFFSIENYDFINLYKKGYNDTQKNKERLDKILEIKEFT